MADGRSAFCRIGVPLLAVAALALLPQSGDNAFAADRKVLGEIITSTTCGYCQYAGRALDRLINNYGDTFVGYQLHVGDPFQTTWTSQRASSLGYGGTPCAWFDAVIQRSGAYEDDAQQFNYYKTAYNSRIAVATDISITITGEEIEPDVYEIKATIEMDAGGTTMNVISHIVKAIDYYPASSDNRYRNCVRGHRDTTTTLNPGESFTHTEVFALSGTDILHITDLKFIAFVDENDSQKEVQNSEIIGYPFPEPQEEVVGDVDGDGDVDLSDLAALLSTYGLCEGDAGYNKAADFVQDDCIDLADLAALLANYGYTP